MKISTVYSAGRLTVYLGGELDHHGAREAMEAIDESIDASLPRDFVLDLSELSFMDSSGIAVILKSGRKMQEAGGRMYIENPQPQPLRVLDASGISRIVPIAAKGEVTT